uniref:T-complex protein 1 subunit eta n=1 Tax=Ciona savignyi TaxID=51511 RepID=H2Z7T8_CIOSA
MQPPIILLKEGTDSSQGIPQLVSNINACQVISEAIRTTLGPRGMDKLIVDNRGKATISNDGATILKLLDVVHPAAKTLVDISKSQDSEVGDGTTTVTLLAAELLKQAKCFVEDGVHPQLIVRAYRQATNLAIQKIKEIQVKIKTSDPKEQRGLLEKCAATALNSKLIASYKDLFAPMVVDAVMLLDDLLPLKMIGIKKISGGALEESKLVSGVAFKKTFSYAGFEMQRKKYKNPKIVLLNVELELKSEKENAEVRVNNVEACGGSIQTSVQHLTDDVLGTCEVFEEEQVGGERFNFFRGCPHAKTCTILLRGGAEQFMEETERSLHDAIMIVRRAIKNDAVVAGGGAIEMEISKHLRSHARTIRGKQQLIISAYGKALEIIARQLCENAGFDATNILNKLRQVHATEDGKWFGVDINNEDITDNFAACVWEPSIVKINALTAAAEAACLILSVDETVKNPRSGQGDQAGPPAGRGRGRPR